MSDINDIEDEVLTAKNDIIFKELFSKKGNEDLLEDLLSSILNQKVKCKSVVKEARIGQLRPDEKYGSLDIRIMLENDVEVDLEMQMVDKKNTLERAAYYVSLLTVEGLEPKEDYCKMKPKIVIFLMDYELFKLENAVVNTFTCLEQDKTVEADKLKKCYFVDLTKMDKIQNNEKLKKWLLFLNNNKKELSKMKEDRLIEKAEEELKYLTGDEEVKRIAQLRERWLRDENRMKELVEIAQKELKEGLKRIEIEKEKACREGMEKGMQKGMQKGRENGIKEGRQKGLQEGSMQTCYNIAKKMLENGINIAEIKEYTSLSEEEITRLK